LKICTTLFVYKLNSRVNHPLMLVLAFDTSTQMGTVGYLQFSGHQQEERVQDFARIMLPAHPGHAEKLLERIEYVLNQGNKKIEDINLVVFGQGPGTFTGLRIGMSCAKALSLAHDIPILGVSTLEMTALCAGVDGVVVSLIDARRNELYCGAYKISRKNGVASSSVVFSPQVIKADHLAGLLAENKIEDKVFLAGNGVEPYRSILLPCGIITPTLNSVPDACQMAAYGYNLFKTNGSDNAASVQPVYLREPDAKLPSKPLV